MTFPFENDTGAIEKRLAKRSLKARKNTVAILAILLSALLFTGLFTVVMDLNAAYEQSTMRAIGTCAHVGLKHATVEEYETLAADDRWAGKGYSIYIGSAAGDAFAKLGTEVRWADAFYAETCFCMPTEGRMPEAEDEIAASRLVLAALGVSDELGTVVPLTIQTDTETVTESFILCGVWDGDTAAGAQMTWLGRAYADKIAPARHGSSVGVDDAQYTGYLNAAFMLPHSWQLEERGFQIFYEHGLGDIFHYNYAYSMSGVTASDLLPVLGLVLLVLAAGYLLIYNIFYISIVQDIHFYGLLKTVGATSKQLRRLVYKKALRLSAVGIPLGLALGWLLGAGLSPAILSGTTLGSSISVHSASPLIFLAGAAFALLTVSVSCRKPARIAGRVSPMEALRYNAAVVSRKKPRRSGAVTPARMAGQNLGRSKKRVAVVALSLALSLVILNTVAAFAGGFDFEKYTAASLATDFAVGDAGVINGMSRNARLSAVDSTLRESIANLEGLEGMGSVYCCFADQPITGELAAIIRDAGQYEEVAQSHMYQNAAGQMDGTVDTRGSMIYAVYGLDDYAVRKLTVLEGELDWDRWRAGEGVFITPAVLWGGKYCLYHPGEAMSVDLTELVDGAAYDYWDDSAARTVGTYEVLAVVELPDAFYSGSSTGSGTRIILPETEYLQYANENARLPMMTVFDVDDGHMAQAEAFVQNYTERVEPTMDYRSRITLEEEYRSLIRMFTLVGGALCGLLALIGILNFINSMTTSVLTRRQELAMLQAVGMTGRQVKKMMILEGLGYALLGVSLALVLGAVVNVTLLRAVTADMFAFTVRFTLTPILLVIPPLLAVSALVPWLCYRKMAGITIVERLRLAE